MTTTATPIAPDAPLEQRVHCESCRAASRCGSYRCPSPGETFAAFTAGLTAAGWHLETLELDGRQLVRARCPKHKTTTPGGT